MTETQNPISQEVMNLLNTYAACADGIAVEVSNLRVMVLPATPTATTASLNKISGLVSGMTEAAENARAAMLAETGAAPTLEPTDAQRYVALRLVVQGYVEVARMEIADLRRNSEDDALRVLLRQGVERMETVLGSLAKDAQAIEEGR